MLLITKLHVAYTCDKLNYLWGNRPFQITIGKVWISLEIPSSALLWLLICHIGSQLCIVLALHGTRNLWLRSQSFDLKKYFFCSVLFLGSLPAAYRYGRTCSLKVCYNSLLCFFVSNVDVVEEQARNPCIVAVTKNLPIKWQGSLMLL